MNDIGFDWIRMDEVPRKLIVDFQCGNVVFDDYLKEEASSYQENCEGVTYVIVTDDELEKHEFTKIHGYVTINATGLLLCDEARNYYLPCAEIKMFAIAKQLRRRHDITINYSDLVFKVILQNLYEISTKVIGFRAIFLNSNDEGKHLYCDNGFMEIDSYIAPSEENGINIEGTCPMILLINDEMLTNIFSET